MAFNGLVEALSSTVHRDTITAPIIEHGSRRFRNSLTRYPYAVPPKLLPLLNSLGINASGFGTAVHPHPFHKSVETHLLYDHWSHLARHPSSVMFMKPEKFQLLHEHNDNFRTLINARFTSRDVARYPISNPTYPVTQTLFIHDALMFLSPGKILDLFEKSPALNQVYASLVAPPEFLKDLPSLYPSVYNFSSSNDNFHYNLETNRTGSYDQPVSSFDWLRIHRIDGPDFSIDVTILESFLSSHSFIFSRCTHPTGREALAPDRHFLCPDSIALPNPVDQKLPLSSRLIPRSVYESVFTYVRAVRTLRETDPAGFVRTQRQKEEYAWVSNSAWDYLSQFALATHAARPDLPFSFHLTILDRFFLGFRRFKRTLAFPFSFFPIAGALLNVFSPLSFILRFHLPILKSIGLYTPYYQSLTSLTPRLFAYFRDQRLVQAPSRTFSIMDLFLRPFGYSTRPAPSFTCFITQRHNSFAFRLDSFLRSWTFPTAVLLSGVFLYCYFSSPSTPQQLNDSYISYFHPKPWKLTVKTHSVSASPEPFFEDLPLVHDTLLNTKPNSFDQPAIDDSKPDLVPSTKSFPTISSDPSVSSDKSKVFAKSQPSSHPTATQPLDAHTNFTTGIAPPSPEEQAISLLEIDSTASGPVLPYRLLHSIPCQPGSCEFLSRRRLNYSSLPMPPNNCLLIAISSALSTISPSFLWNILATQFPDSQLNGPAEISQGLSTDHLEALAYAVPFFCTVHADTGSYDFGPDDAPHIVIGHETNVDGAQNHWFFPARPLPTQPAPLRGANSFASAALSFRTSSGHLLPFKKIHDYSLNPHRAKNLASNLKNETDGVLASLFRTGSKLDPSFFSRLDQRADLPPKRTVSLIHLTGFPGCGKTWPVIQLLKSKLYKHSFRVAVPTIELRHEWKSLTNLPAPDAWRVSTWESSLTKSAPVLIIDEVYKMPRGYLDLCLLADPLIEFVILLGDPCQSSYSSTNPDSSNFRLSSEITHLAPYRDYYCFWTHRLPFSIARLYGVETHSKILGSIGRTNHPKRDQLILVPSISAARAFTASGLRAVTFAGSQGLTVKNPVSVFVDKNIRSIHHSAALVATTRSTKGINFSGSHDYLLRFPGSCPILESLYHQKPIDFFSLFNNELSGSSVLTKPLVTRKPSIRGSAPTLRGGSHWASLTKRYHRQTNFRFDPAHVRPARSPLSKPLTSDYKEDVLSEAPLLFDHANLPIPRVDTTFLPETRRPLHQDIPSALPFKSEITKVELSDTAFEPVYPGIDYQMVAANLMPAIDPDSQEITFRGSSSNQFPHLDIPFEYMAQTLSVIAPKHDAKHDPSLLLASIEKRLRFRKPGSPYSISPTDELLGTLLFSNLCYAYRRDPSVTFPFLPDLYAECINLNEYSQLSSKTQSVIMANANRSHPDWRYNVVDIFSKTQHKINEGSIFGKWKACQTLALMHDAVILLFGPVKKYQRIFDDQDRPQNLFVYGGKTPFDLSHFARERLVSGALHLCNDYTAFDQSQHGEAVVLETLKMKRVNIPDNLIQLHRFIKTNIQSQFGSLTCMRLTGEPGTYDDNTDYNIAVIYSQYLISGEAVFVSGDDSDISPVPMPNPAWNVIQPLLHLTFKTEIVNHGLFCGYFLSSSGAVRAPRPLLIKAVLAENDGTLDTKMASYLSEFVVGHSLGDDMWNSLPLEQVSFQAALFDFFCRRASKEQKISLKIGEVPEDICRRLLSLGFSWVSRPLYALLDRASRLRLLRNTSNATPLIEPEFEGVLQLNF